MTNEGKRMDALTKAATILSKIGEIAYDIGAVSMLVALIIFLVKPSLVNAAPNTELSVRGFSIVCADAQGNLNTPACIIFFIAAGLTMGLIAFVFRNVNLILRTTLGKTKFSKGQTPFQPDNVRMVREIGIFFFAITVIQMIASWAASVSVSVEAMEVSIGMDNVVIGILMLCLSQVFAVGQKMQEDIDGLV